MLAEALRSRGADLFRLVHGLHEKPGRSPFELALMRGHTDAGHRLAALVICNEAEGWQHRLRVFQLDRRVRILLIAVPCDAHAAGGNIPRRRERRISQEAWLGAGSE